MTFTVLGESSSTAPRPIEPEKVVVRGGRRTHQRGPGPDLSPTRVRDFADPVVTMSYLVPAPFSLTRPFRLDAGPPVKGGTEPRRHPPRHGPSQLSRHL